MFSAGQIRDRARLLEFRTAEEVTRVRRELDPAVAALLHVDGDFPTSVDKLFMAPPMTDGFLFPRTPQRPRDLPNLSLFHDRPPMQAPGLFREAVLNDSTAQEAVLLPTLSEQNRTEPFGLPADQDRAPVQDPSLVNPVFTAVGESSPEPDFEGILIRIIQGDATAQTELDTLAAGEDKYAAVARKITNEYWPAFQDALNSKTRLEFAQKLTAFMQQEYDVLLAALLSGEQSFDTTFIERCYIVAEALSSLLAVDRFRGRTDYQAWMGNDEAEKILHNGPSRIIVGLKLLEYGPTEPTEFTDLVETNDRHGTLLVNAVLDSAMQNRISAAGRGVRILVNVPREVPLRADLRGQMAEVLTELLHNATVKYADTDKPERWVRVEWLPGSQTLAVMDNGIGIADTNRIWNGDASAREQRNDSPGTGQGLAFAKAQLTKMGWEIRVESTVGEGSAFFITRGNENPAFDIPNLTPELVERLSPTEKLELNLALMQYRQATAERIQAEISDLIARAGEENIWPRIAELRDEVTNAEQHSHNLWARGGNLFELLRTSSGQILTGTRLTLRGAISANAAGHDALPLLQEIVDEPMLLSVSVAEGLEFSTPVINAETQHQIPNWLRTHEPRTEELDGRKLVIRYPAETTTTTDKSNTLNVLPSQVWPPNPADPIVATMLRALGWEMSAMSLPEGGMEVRLWEKGAVESVIPELPAEPAVIEQTAKNPIPNQTLLADLVKGFFTGDTAAFAELQRLAAIAEPASGAAQIILDEYWQFAQELSHAPNRLAFANIAEPFVQQEYDKLLEQLLSGHVQFDQAFRHELASRADALLGVVRGADQAHHLQNNTWYQDRDAELIMHHGPLRAMGAMLRASSNFFAQRNLNLNIMSFAGAAAPDDRDGIKVLNVVIEAVMQNLLQLQALQIQLEISVPRDVSLSADPRQGEQEYEAMLTALTELVNNVVKYSDPANPTKPELWMKIQWNAEQRTLVVSDNGIGIADTSRVWQGDESAREKRNEAEGTGLGLGDIQKILAEVGYEITVESTVGEGSTFSIRPMMSIP